LQDMICSHRLAEIIFHQQKKHNPLAISKNYTFTFFLMGNLPTKPQPNIALVAKQFFSHLSNEADKQMTNFLC
jgi:hypothetical protein